MTLTGGKAGGGDPYSIDAERAHSMDGSGGLQSSLRLEAVG